MSNLNVNVLVAAKQEYFNQIINDIEPLVREGFMSIWEDSEQNTETFKDNLRNIPNWNQTMLEEETRRILQKVEYLPDLITAVFIAHVKILASVRLGNKNTNIKIVIPQTSIFIHRIYMLAAEIFINNTEIFEYPYQRNSYEDFYKIIEVAIKNTICSLIPIKDIIQQYLSDSFQEHVVKIEQGNSQFVNSSLFGDSPNTPTSPHIPDTQTSTHIPDIPTSTHIPTPPPIPDIPTSPPIPDIPTYQSIPDIPTYQSITPNTSISSIDIHQNTTKEIPINGSSPLFGETLANDGGIGDLLSTSSSPQQSPLAKDSHSNFNFFSNNDNNII